MRNPRRIENALIEEIDFLRKKAKQAEPEARYEQARHQRSKSTIIRGDETRGNENSGSTESR